MTGGKKKNPTTPPHMKIFRFLNIFSPIFLLLSKYVGFFSLLCLRKKHCENRMSRHRNVHGWNILVTHFQSALDNSSFFHCLFFFEVTCFYMLQGIILPIKWQALPTCFCIVLMSCSTYSADKFGKIFLIVSHEGAVRMSSFHVSMVKDYKDTLQLLAI